MSDETNPQSADDLEEPVVDQHEEPLENAEQDDLDLEDVTPNDPGDPDIGTNNLQNFPSLTSVDRLAANVNGTLDSIPSSNFDVDLYVTFSNDFVDDISFGFPIVYFFTDALIYPPVCNFANP